MINSACRGSASYSIRSRPDPKGGLSHLKILFSILTSVTSPRAVHGPSVARLCSRARHHQVVAVSEHRHVNCARMVQTRRKLVRVVSHRCHGILTRNIQALCSILRSVRSFVQNCVPTRALVIFSWHFDHARTTFRAVEMRPTDLVESQNSLSLSSAGARRLPVIQRLSMTLRLSSGSLAAKVLLASSGVNSLTLVVSCATSLARMNGHGRTKLLRLCHSSSRHRFQARSALVL